MVVGVGDYSFTVGDLSFGGISLGSLVAVIAYPVLRALQRRAGGPATGAGPADLPVVSSPR